MYDEDSPSLAEDKHWAKKYLLDPLTAPEPNQETGPGSSFINPLHRSLSLSHGNSSKGKGRGPPTGTGTYPSPPPSASPTRSSFHSSNPFWQGQGHPRAATEFSITEGGAPVRRSRSVHSHSPGIPSPTSPPRHGRYPPGSRYNRVPEGDVHNPNPFADAGLNRSQSTRYRPSRSGKEPELPEGQGAPIRRSNSTNTNPSNTGGIRRHGSINQRYPGDMSHRPLDMIKREVRAADRVPHLRRKAPPTDTIDSLDDAAVGGAYHHGGPYDATLASRNTNPMYSPLAAVHDSNMEALKATPREYIKDSLEKHVPLQGTANIPPGQPDMTGKVYNYEEGADLMREPDAAGGAYKRWDGIAYQPDDIHGKGEPSYTYDKSARHPAKSHKQSLSSGAVEYEMQPGVNARRLHRKDGSVMVRQRSISNAADGRPGPSDPVPGASGADLQRSNTTGKRFSDGLKRRFGSLRRKMNNEDAN